MVPLVRGPAPTVLANTATAWTQQHLAERMKYPNKRPDSKRYGHIEVRVELRAMSHHKCFYCERRLSESEQQVDHYIEAAEQPQSSFDWDNLYLSCPSCNIGKPPNLAQPVAACLDPCAPGIAPDQHLAFNDEFIEPLSGSKMGRATILKYRLDRPELEGARSRVLRDFMKIQIQIKDRMIADGRTAMSDDERELLRRFGDPIRPFSLMMKSHLSPLGL